MNSRGVWVAICSTIILLSGVTGITIYQDVFAKADKVTICHMPDGNQGNELIVSPNALKNHFNHGDWIGTCSAGPDCDNHADQPLCEAVPPSTEPKPHRLSITCELGEPIEPSFCLATCTGSQTICDDTCSGEGLGVAVACDCLRNNPSCGE